MPSRHLAATVVALVGVFACAEPAPPAPEPFALVEATIPQMREAMEQGRLTSHQLVEMYLARIGMYQQTLKAAIYVNANALKEADERDRERAAGRVRGPLHGIPIALKDNIHTTNMPTSGGALAFDGFIPPYEATLTKNLTDGRRDHHRQGGVVRAGRLRRRRADAGARRLQRRGRSGLQPVRSAPRSAARHRGRPAGAEHRRLELGHRHGRESVGGEHRHRNVGLDSRAVESDHARRGEADGRPREPLGRDPDHGGSGYGRSDGADRDRRRDSARRARRAPHPIPTTLRRRAARRRRATTTRRS